MTDPFLEDCGGWTPAPDALTRNKRYGFEGAYLWGRLRRLCQLGGGTYKISHEALGDRIGMSRRTVIKYLDRLIEDGYVEDLDAGVKNRAHTYSVKMGEDKILSGMQISHTDSDIIPDEAELDNDVGMRNLHTESAEIAHQDDTGMQELPSRYAKNAHPGMQNLHLNRESLDTDSRNKESKELSPKQKMFLLLADLCHINLKASTEKQKGQLGTTSKALIELIPDLDQFKVKFPNYWQQIDWRGKQGQPPTPPQIQEVYGDYCYWLENGVKQNGQHSKQPTEKPDLTNPDTWAAQLEAASGKRSSG